MKRIYFLLILTLIALTSSRTDSSIFFGEDQESGLIELHDDSDMFYWYFKARNNPKKAPLLIWLSGGPGCSSSFALFYENGPYFIEEDLTLKKNQHSWNEYANLLYVDQPLGTGYSKVNADNVVTNEDQVASDFRKFLLIFMAKYPELAERPMYITGESYAGKYIPAIAEHLTSSEGSHPLLNLKGIAIGNGMTSPIHQLESNADFALKNTLISYNKYVQVKKTYRDAVEAIKRGDFESSMAFYGMGTMQITGFPYKFNIYRIDKECVGPLCYDMTKLTAFMNRNNVRDELGVSGRDWEACNGAVHKAMTNDIHQSVIDRLAKVLDEHKEIKVLLFYGTLDFICNWMGGEQVANNIPWEGKEAFKKAKYETWNANGVASGEIKRHENLSFLKFWNSGHMVPMDKPVEALFMLNELIGKKVVNEFME